jgi:diaminopimelate epimerase
LKFIKYQATGNDFIMVNGFEWDNDLTEDQIKYICERHFGIGSDGLIILRPDEKTDFFMDFYNPDGSKAGFCGNGGRCSVKMANELGIIEKETVFRARDGVHRASLVGRDEVLLGMQDVCSFRDYDPEIYVNTGTHHAVVFVDDVNNVDIVPRARLLRYEDRYAPEGTNVNFVQIIDAGEIKVRTYEKGVEAETLSCGTGVVASALVSARRMGWGAPVIVHTRGGDLKVFFNKKENCYADVYLQGPARKVFSGEIEL